MQTALESVTIVVLLLFVSFGGSYDVQEECQELSIFWRKLKIQKLIYLF